MSDTIDVNIKSAFAIMRVFIPGMKERQFGHIINIGSNAANRFLKGTTIVLQLLLLLY